MHHGPHHRFAHQNHDDDDVMVSWIIMMYHDGHTVGVHPVCRDRLLIRPVCAHLSFFTIFTQLFHSATIFAPISPYLTRSGQHFHSDHSASLFTNSFTQCGESSTLLLLFHPAHIRPKVYYLHSVHNVLKKWVVLVLCNCVVYLDGLL